MQNGHIADLESTDDIINETKETIFDYGLETNLLPVGYPLDNDEVFIQETPIMLQLFNFTEKRKQKEQWFSSPFLTFKEGHLMRFKVLTAGIYKDDTHVSVFLQIMKGPYDDFLQQSGHFPMYGYIVIELLSQAMGKSHHIRVVPFDERSCSECANRVTDGTGATWLGFYNFTSTESVDTYYLTDDSLQFRITYTKYAYYCKTIILYSNELPNILLVALVDSFMVYPLLILVEFIAFCIQNSNILIPTCIDFSFCSVEKFLSTKQSVLVGTWYVAFCTALWMTVTLCAVEVMEIIFLAIGELMLWDVITAMDNAKQIIIAMERLVVVVGFSAIVNQYVMSWDSKIIMINPLWTLHIMSYVCK